MEMADERSTSGTTLSTGTVPEKQWTHLAITVDRKNFKTRYYFNGRLDSVRDLPRAFTGNLSVPGRPLSTGTWQPFVSAGESREVTVESQPRDVFFRTKSALTESELGDLLGFPVARVAEAMETVRIRVGKGTICDTLFAPMIMWQQCRPVAKEYADSHVLRMRIRP